MQSALFRGPRSGYAPSNQIPSLPWRPRQTPPLPLFACSIVSGKQRPKPQIFSRFVTSGERCRIDRRACRMSLIGWNGLSHPVKPLLVADVSMLQTAARALSNFDVFGIDTETKPRFDSEASPNPPSLLQVAGMRSNDSDIPQEVYVFDLLTLLRPEAVDNAPRKVRLSSARTLSKHARFLDKALGDILRDENRLKVGVSIDADLAGLARFYGNQCDSFASPVAGVLDLGRVVGDSRQWGLRRLSDHFVGFKLAKRQARSNWGRRPLREGQLLYAANDARLSLASYSAGGRAAFSGLEHVVDLCSRDVWVCGCCGKQYDSKRGLLRACAARCAVSSNSPGGKVYKIAVPTRERSV